MIKSESGRRGFEMYSAAKKTAVKALCFLLMLCVLSGIFTTASASTAEDTGLTLIFKNDTDVFVDVEWSIYKAARRNEQGELELCCNFAGYSVALDDESTSAVQAAADTLENYAILDSITPIDKKSTNEKGTVYFDGTDDGVYLVIGKSWVEDGVRYIPSPMLVEFSEFTDEYLIAYPKFKMETLPETDVEYKVMKNWIKDEDYPHHRPEDVQIELYKDSVLTETVILDESNNWEYSWVSEPEAEWRVKEREVPDNYAVVYSSNAFEFIVENTHKIVKGGYVQFDPPIDTTDKNTSGDKIEFEKLPQTGLLWWPVPVLALAGLILIAVGYKLNRSGKNKEVDNAENQT